MSPTFTTLPLEIRNEIYSHLFLCDSITPIYDDTGKVLYLNLNKRPRRADDKPSNPQTFLALLSVNHQISDEAAVIFYGKTTFYGTWPQVVAFVKGVGARRKNMIRSMQLEVDASLFGKNEDLDDEDLDDEDFEMLSGLLPNLRTLHIAASAPDFTRLQNQLIQGGILKIAGKVDIDVCSTWVDEKWRDSKSRVRQIYEDRHVWRCDKGTTQWTGGVCDRTILWQLDVNRHLTAGEGTA